jgi:hypothetical protein
MGTTGDVDGLSSESIATKNALHDLVARIEGEYREMPGMCVTPPQAQRLWGLDSATCEIVLSMLLDRHIVRKTWRGTYVKC